MAKTIYISASVFAFVYAIAISHKLVFGAVFVACLAGVLVVKTPASIWMCTFPLDVLEICETLIG